MTVSSQVVRTGISQIPDGTDRHQHPARHMGHITMPILDLKEAKEDPWVNRVAKEKESTCTELMQRMPSLFSQVRHGLVVRTHAESHSFRDLICFVFGV